MDKNDGVKINYAKFQNVEIINSKDKKVKMDSLYKGYPVGYIITWKNPDVKLKDGTLANGKKVLIDGQQRITALTAAIVGQEVVGSDYKKKKIKIAFNLLEEVFEVSNPAIQKNNQWIDDISLVFKNEFSMWSFMPAYCQKNNIEINESNKVGKSIERLLQIKNSRLGIIDLSHKLELVY